MLALSIPGLIIIDIYEAGTFSDNVWPLPKRSSELLHMSLFVFAMKSRSDLN